MKTLENQLRFNPQFENQDHTGRYVKDCLHDVQKLTRLQNCHLPAAVCKGKCALKKNNKHLLIDHLETTEVELRRFLTRKIDYNNKTIAQFKREIVTELETGQELMKQLKENLLQQVDRLFYEAVKLSNATVTAKSMDKFFHSHLNALTCHQVFCMFNLKPTYPKHLDGKIAQIQSSVKDQLNEINQITIEMTESVLQRLTKQTQLLVEAELSRLPDQGQKPQLNKPHQQPKQPQKIVAEQNSQNKANQVKDVSINKAGQGVMRKVQKSLDNNLKEPEMKSILKPAKSGELVNPKPQQPKPKSSEPNGLLEKFNKFSANFSNSSSQIQTKPNNSLPETIPNTKSTPKIGQQPLNSTKITEKPPNDPNKVNNTQIPNLSSNAKKILTHPAQNNKQGTLRFQQPNQKPASENSFPDLLESFNKTKSLNKMFESQKIPNQKSLNPQTSKPTPIQTQKTSLNHPIRSQKPQENKVQKTIQASPMASGKRVFEQMKTQIEIRKEKYGPDLRKLVKTDINSNPQAQNIKKPWNSMLASQRAQSKQKGFSTIQQQRNRQKIDERDKQIVEIQVEQSENIVGDESKTQMQVSYNVIQKQIGATNNLSEKQPSEKIVQQKTTRTGQAPQISGTQAGKDNISKDQTFIQSNKMSVEQALNRQQQSKQLQTQQSSKKQTKIQLGLHKQATQQQEKNQAIVQLNHVIKSFLRKTAEVQNYQASANTAKTRGESSAPRVFLSKPKDIIEKLPDPTNITHLSEQKPLPSPFQKPSQPNGTISQPHKQTLTQSPIRIKNPAYSLLGRKSKNVIFNQMEFFEKSMQAKKQQQMKSQEFKKGSLLAELQKSSTAQQPPLNQVQSLQNAQPQAHHQPNQKPSESFSTWDRVLEGQARKKFTVNNQAYESSIPAYLKPKDT